MALPVTGAWQRHVMTPKGEWVDTPEPHPLSYFIDDPGSRCEQCDFCWDCSPEKRLAESRKVKADLILVGELAGFGIFDLYYRFESDRRSDTKLILVTTEADEYREIYQCTPTTFFGSGAMRSRLVTIGDDQFLETKYDACGGRHNLVDGSTAADYYDYFWFDKAGAEFVDFRPILRAAKSVMRERFPFNDELLTPCVNWLWHFGEPLLCTLGTADGTATVRFRFNRGRVMVLNTLYKPAKSMQK
jgi:hypothetical protein